MSLDEIITIYHISGAYRLPGTRVWTTPAYTRRDTQWSHQTYPHCYFRHWFTLCHIARCNKTHTQLNNICSASRSFISPVQQKTESLVPPSVATPTIVRLVSAPVAHAQYCYLSSANFSSNPPIITTLVETRELFPNPTIRNSCGDPARVLLIYQLTMNCSQTFSLLQMNLLPQRDNGKLS